MFICKINMYICNMKELSGFLLFLKNTKQLKDRLYAIRKNGRTIAVGKKTHPM